MRVEIKGRTQVSGIGKRVGEFVGERYRRVKGVPGEIRVGQEAFTLSTTHDFDVKDPWTSRMRDILITNAHKFSAKPLWEFGIGDGRNPFAIIKALAQQGLEKPTKVVGIELDGWRKRLARKNLREVKDEVPNELIKADATRWIQDALKQKETLEGNAILCLPQAPLVEKISNGDKKRRRKISSADGYAEEDLPEYAQEWNKYGLGLNSAVLTGLAAVADPEFRAFAMFSGRVPHDKLSEMLDKAGWDIAEIHGLGMAQQDPDTPVAYTKAFDIFAETGKPEDALFFQKVGKNYVPITAEEAENRRVESMASGKGRADLNVHHKLLVVELTKKESDFASLPVLEHAIN